MPRPLPRGRLLAMACALFGVGMAVYLTLRPSGAFQTLSWLPRSIAAWSDEFGRFRNFPAYALLAVPFLFLSRASGARRRTLGWLAVLAAGMEFVQLSVATRWFEWEDIAWSWAGLAFTGAVVEMLHYSRGVLGSRTTQGPRRVAESKDSC